MSLEVFSAKFLTSFHENESRKIMIIRGFDVHLAFFKFEILYFKYMDLIDKLKEVKKVSIFLDSVLTLC
jgi:hypothetical protein